MGKISGYDPDANFNDTDYLVGVDASTGITKRFLGSVVHFGLAKAADLAAHVLNMQNPHNTNALQVGLGNVPNVDATQRANHTGTQPSSTISDFSAAADARIAAQKAAVSGLASLDANGLVPVSQIPALHVNNVFTAASQAAMLALSAGIGDVCVRTDNSNTYILTATPASTLGNWTQVSNSAQALTDANLTTSDITTNNVSTSKHGFAPKLPNDATKYLDGSGNYSTPAGSSVAQSATTQVAQTAHGFSVGNWVALSVAGNYVLAIATPTGAHDALGIVSVVTDANHFTFQSLGNFTTAVAGGLVPGVAYFLSPTTAGDFTPVEPSGANVVAKPLFTALNETTGVLNIQTSYTNSAGSTVSPGSKTTVMGTNVMNDQTGTSDAYKTAENAADLALLTRHLGGKRVRIALPSYNSTDGVANARQLALAYKAAGYFVSYGVTGNSGSQNATTYAAWKAQVPTEAAWAHTNNIDRFYIGNEEDWQAQIGNFGTVTDATVRTDVLSLAATLKAAYPSMEIVYSTAQGTVSQWHTAGTGSLDHLGFNMYDTQANFPANLDYFASQIGSKYFVSEWAAEHDYKTMVTTGGSTGVYTDAQYAADLLSRYNALVTRGLEAYFFALRYGDDTRTAGNWNILDNNNTFVPGSREAFGFGGSTVVTGNNTNNFVQKSGDTMTGMLGSERNGGGSRAHWGQSLGYSSFNNLNVDDQGNIDDSTVQAWSEEFAQDDDAWHLKRTAPGGGWNPSTMFSVSANPNQSQAGGLVQPGVAFAPQGVAVTDAAVVQIDASLGNVFALTLGGNRTLNVPMNPVAGQRMVLLLKQDGTGSRLVTWVAAGWRFSTDIPSPTLTTTANYTDRLEFIYNGADEVWDCVRVTKGFKPRVIVTNIMQNNNATNGSSQATASITPAAGILYLLSVESRTGITANPNQPTVSGAGLTWVAINSVVYDDTSSSRRRVTLFRAMGAGSPGVLTIDFASQVQTQVQWTLDQAVNVNTGGTNGSSAVVQSATNFNDNGTSPVDLHATLAAFGSANNATYLALGTGDSGSGFTLTPDTGYIGLTAFPLSQSPLHSATAWRPDNDTNPGLTTSTPGGTYEIGIVAIEIASA